MNKDTAAKHAAGPLVVDSIIRKDLALDLARLGVEDVVEIQYSKLRKSIFEAFQCGVVIGWHCKSDE